MHPSSPSPYTPPPTHTHTSIRFTFIRPSPTTAPSDPGIRLLLPAISIRSWDPASAACYIHPILGSDFCCLRYPIHTMQCTTTIRQSLFCIIVRIMPAKQNKSQWLWFPFQSGTSLWLPYWWCYHELFHSINSLCPSASGLPVKRNTLFPKECLHIEI
jgi:hypothetical protein